MHHGQCLPCVSISGTYLPLVTCVFVRVGTPPVGAGAATIAAPAPPGGVLREAMGTGTPKCMREYYGSTSKPTRRKKATTLAQHAPKIGHAVYESSSYGEIFCADRSEWMRISQHRYGNATTRHPCTVAQGCRYALCNKGPKPTQKTTKMKKRGTGIKKVAPRKRNIAENDGQGCDVPRNATGGDGVRLAGSDPGDPGRCMKCGPSIESTTVGQVGRIVVSGGTRLNTCS